MIIGPLKMLRTELKAEEKFLLLLAGMFLVAAGVVVWPTSWENAKIMIVFGMAYMVVLMTAERLRPMSREEKRRFLMAEVAIMPIAFGAIFEGAIFLLEIGLSETKVLLLMAGLALFGLLFGPSVHLFLCRMLKPLEKRLELEKVVAALLLLGPLAVALFATGLTWVGKLSLLFFFWAAAVNFARACRLPENASWSDVLPLAVRVFSFRWW